MHASAHAMAPLLKQRSLSDFAAMSEQDTRALLGLAHRLQTASQAGLNGRILRGKNLALLCDTVDADGAELFQRAASDLGAQVAHLRPSLSKFSTPQEVQHTARVLGRLYDALDCVGMPPELVRQIGVAAGVPVFEAISSNRHPTAALAGQLNGDSTDVDKRCAVMQAVLLGALA
jgi:ornithine carbamoyltransferase